MHRREAFIPTHTPMYEDVHSSEPDGCTLHLSTAHLPEPTRFRARRNRMACVFERKAVVVTPRAKNGFF